MNADTERLERMLGLVESYRAGQCPLGLLIGDLEFLNDAISDGNDACKRAMRTRIGDLEQAYAVMLDRNMGQLDDAGKRIVEQGLQEITTLIAAAKRAARSAPGDDRDR